MATRRPVDKDLEEDKGSTLRELAEEDGAIMRDLPGDAAPSKKDEKRKRKGLPSEEVTAQAAANAMRCGGATSIYWGD